jgi:2-octaprenylphenol hydroxylase
LSQHKPAPQGDAEYFDLVIVGSGIAGSALAVALAGTDLRVAIVEAQNISAGWPEQTDSVTGFDLRVSALTAASQAFLTELGVWSMIASRRLSPYQKMTVWDADGTGEIHFDAADLHQPALGHIVENRLIVAALLQKVQLAANVVLLNPAKVEAMFELRRSGFNRSGFNSSGFNSSGFNSSELNSSEPRSSTKTSCYELTLDNGVVLNAGLVVGADGAMSRIREWAGFKTREWDYGHQALVATIETTQGHQSTAWQRFMPEGPLALLPLTSSSQDMLKDRFCSIVWSTEPDQAQSLLALDDESFCQHLTKASESRLGDVISVSRRMSFPLRQRHAIDYVKPGVVLIADAAHTIHPLAGQGINIGLHDVNVLAEELIRATQRNLGVGSMQVLGRYQRRCKARNLGMMATMEGFKRLFADRAVPVRWLRNEGMNRLNKMGLAKQWIIKRAMGL